MFVITQSKVGAKLLIFKLAVL